MRLHLGCGKNILPNWDNLDLNGPIACDLRQPLSYSLNSVSLIYSEHFLEHLDEVDGFHLLQECYRVLIPKGILRISCPDLAQYIKAYLHWEQEPSDPRFTNGISFLNYAILGEAKNGLKYLSPIQQSKDEGHKYYYDEEDLRRKLLKIGFTKVDRCNWGISTTPELSHLETRQSRNVIVEAIK